MITHYKPRRPSESLWVEARGIRHHIRAWGPVDAPPLWLLHGWMDGSASFQFLVDELQIERRIYAPDWRGYGLTERAPGIDAYWFPDYLADLEAMLDALAPGQPIDLAAHSMGGNIACLYAGVRPSRIRRLVNLEGYGLPGNRPDQAPERYAQWLDELSKPERERIWPSLEALVSRMCRNNPRLGAERATWLAQHWAQAVEVPAGEAADTDLPSRDTPTTGWQLRGDPAHRRRNPVLYRVEEVLACWRQITAPVLLVEAGEPDDWHQYTREPAYRERLAAFASLQTATVAGSGHMLHHDQPEAVARLIESFLGQA
jgi:pimeloyl-ACP methyl ester carboxylesterase